MACSISEFRLQACSHMEFRSMACSLPTFRFMAWRTLWSGFWLGLTPCLRRRRAQAATSAIPFIAARCQILLSLGTSQRRSHTIARSSAGIPGFGTLTLRILAIWNLCQSRPPPRSTLRPASRVTLPHLRPRARKHPTRRPSPRSTLRPSLRPPSRTPAQLLVERMQWLGQLRQLLGVGVVSVA